MIVIGLLFIILITGLALFFIAKNEKWKRVGEIMFACALLAFCFALNSEVLLMLRK